MSVKIYSSTNMGGIPTLEYSIDINGVSIGIRKEDFDSLVKEMGTSIAEDLEKAKQVKEGYWKNVKQLQELRKDIVSIFWDGEADDDYLLRKESKKIDEDKLFEVLERYNRFLGFE